MSFRLQFRRYALPFRAAVRTAHGPWATREGLLLRVEGADGRVGFGEAAPIPQFTTETVDADETALRELGARIEDARIGDVPAKLACLQHALRDAVGQASEAAATSRQPPPTPYLSVAALLPGGRAAMTDVGAKADAGFRVFKWKVGVGDHMDELGLLDDLCAALPDGARLRLDANGAWDRRQAERWLERCAERPVEFVEQPCLAPPDASDREQRRVDDVLRGLANDYPTPVALDESVAGNKDIERWLGDGWPGVFVVKPSLIADLDAALVALTAARAKVVFSSALETALGASHALRAAFRWGGEVRAVGFGVWPLFADARFNGPAAAPFIRWEDIARIKLEAIWTALS